jgi:hypothetical protein
MGAEGVAQGVDVDEARRMLRRDTPLTEAQVTEIINGISTDIRQMMGTADNNQPLADDVAVELREAAADYIASLDEEGAPQVTQTEVRRALRDLDSEVLLDASRHLVFGDPDAVKHVLAANTALTRREINDLVDGVEADMRSTIQEYRAEIEQMSETASDYAQAVVWTAFGTLAIALVVSILGGWLGTEATRRIEVSRVHPTTEAE